MRSRLAREAARRRSIAEPGCWSSPLAEVRPDESDLLIVQVPTIPNTRQLPVLSAQRIAHSFGRYAEVTRQLSWRRRRIHIDHLQLFRRAYPSRSTAQQNRSVPTMLECCWRRPKGGPSLRKFSVRAADPSVARWNPTELTQPCGVAQLCAG